MSEMYAPTVDEPQSMGLPITNAKLAMWLFMATEIMFFSALIGVYIVYRFGQPYWPTTTDVGLVEWMGAVNTFVLICSSVSVVLAYKALDDNQVSRAVVCILITLALGCVFLVIKAFEYKAKFEHHIVPGHVRMDNGLTERVDAAYLEDLKRSVGVLEKVSPRGPEQDQVLDEAKQFAADLDSGKAPQRERIETARKLHHDVEHAFGGTTFPRKHSHADPNTGKLVEEVVEGHFTQVVPTGNLWASLYFTLTGIHALHVIGGLVIFIIMLVLAVMGKFGVQHKQFVELTGLYWHFVDIVWIFLFPLLYLVA